MIVLVIVIFWLLRRYKNQNVVIGTAGTMSMSDAEACRENAENMRIAATMNIFKSSKNTNQSIIYNNTKDIVDNRRLSAKISCNFETNLDKTSLDDCKNAKNVNITKECNALPKVYKIVSVESIDKKPPKSIDNSKMDNNSTDDDDDDEPVMTIGQLSTSCSRTENVNSFTRPSLVANLHRHQKIDNGEDLV